MNAIVSVTADWGIGLKGQLLVSNQEDMRHFVALTRGRCVLMGRATFESFPKGPLKGRRNIVLSSNGSYVRPGFPREGTAATEGYEVYPDVRSALDSLGEQELKDAWLIGGESLYRTLLPLCDEAEVTLNDVVVPADAYFPNLDEDASWQLKERREGGVTAEGVPFRYLRYVHHRR